MKNKKEKNSKMSEIYKILDNKYFHICTEYNPNKIDKCNWTIYYSNLPSKVYFSNKNKALLNSDENSINDIYKLKEKFETEKNKELIKNYKEYSNISYQIYKVIHDSKLKMHNMLFNQLFIILMANIFNFIFIKNQYFSILILFLVLAIAGCMLFDLAKYDKEGECLLKKFKEEYIRNKIKQQGLFFVERLRK